MWYVIQTTTGKEEELAGIVRRNVSHELYDSCFSMKRELLKRLGGGWTTVTETMFPSYVFLETEQPERLFYELKRLPEYTRLLGDNEGCFIPLEKEEENFLDILRRNEKETCVAGLTTLDLDENGNTLFSHFHHSFFTPAWYDTVSKTENTACYLILFHIPAGRTPAGLPLYFSFFRTFPFFSQFNGQPRMIFHLKS